MTVRSPLQRVLVPAIGGITVVTGGLGSLGLLTASWLLKQGVRRLHLVSLGVHVPGTQTPAGRGQGWPCCRQTISVAVYREPQALADEASFARAG